jgi:hypothetical protein
MRRSGVRIPEAAPPFGLARAIFVIWPPSARPRSSRKQPIEQPRPGRRSHSGRHEGASSTKPTASLAVDVETWLYVFLVTLICECLRTSITTRGFTSAPACGRAAGQVRLTTRGPCHLCSAARRNSLPVILFARSHTSYPGCGAAAGHRAGPCSFLRLSCASHASRGGGSRPGRDRSWRCRGPGAGCRRPGSPARSWRSIPVRRAGRTGRAPDRPPRR